MNYPVFCVLVGLYDGREVAWLEALGNKSLSGLKNKRNSAKRLYGVFSRNRARFRYHLPLCHFIHIIHNSYHL